MTGNSPDSAMPDTLSSTCRVSVLLAFAALFLLTGSAAPLHAALTQPLLLSSQDSLPGTPAPSAAVPQSVSPPRQPESGQLQVPPVVVPPRKMIQVIPDAVLSNVVLTEDMVWRGEVRVEGGVTVAPQATLTIEPGTTVRFGSAAGTPDARGALVIQGRLVAVGTGERSIRFSSWYEQSQAGDWQGIVLLGSEKRNRLENCRIEGADVAVDGAFATIALLNTLAQESGIGIRCRDCLLTMEGGGARHNDLGIMLGDSEADLREAEVSENRRGLDVVRSSLWLAGSNLEENGTDALYADASRLSLSGSRFKGNGMGVTLVASEGTVTGNVVSGNHGHGVSLSRSRIRMNGNAIERNGGNGLQVADGAAAAWGNVFAGNSPYDCYHAGGEDFLAVGNWWGTPDGSEAAKRIYDRRTDPRRGVVLLAPVLTARPAAIR